MMQKTRKRKKRFFLGLGATSRLTVPGLTDTFLHRNPGQRGVLSHQERPNPNSQPPGSLLPAYGSPPTANGWYFLFVLPKGDNYCSPSQQLSQWELSPQGLGKAESLIPGMVSSTSRNVFKPWPCRKKSSAIQSRRSVRFLDQASCAACNCSIALSCCLRSSSAPDLLSMVNR